MPTPAEQVATALKMVASKGGPMDVIYPGVATPDPDRSWEMVATLPVTVPTTGVKLAAKHVKYGLATDQQADTHSIPNEEARVILAAGALPSRPRVDCQLRIGADVWKIVSVASLNPAGVDIIYTLQVRR